jgi:uncharacterized protein
MKKHLSLILVVIIAFAFVQCDNGKKKERKTIKPGGINTPVYNFENPPKFRKDAELVFLSADGTNQIYKIDIEVASNDEERARGLMYRPEMEDNHGMLFLFDSDQIQSFYMRNTVLSLDILYVNSKMQIVHIYNNTIPYSEESLPSKAPAKYVVEINAGLCEKYGIQEGDIIRYQ